MEFFSPHIEFMQNVLSKLLGNVFGKMKEMIDFHRLSVSEFLGKGNLAIMNK